MRTLYESITDDDNTIQQQSQNMIYAADLLKPIAEAVKMMVEKYEMTVAKSGLASPDHGLGSFVRYSCDRNLDKNKLIVEINQYINDKLSKEIRSNKIRIGSLPNSKCWDYDIKDKKILDMFNLHSFYIEMDFDYIYSRGEVRVGAYRGYTKDNIELCNLFLNLLMG